MDIVDRLSRKQTISYESGLQEVTEIPSFNYKIAQMHRRHNSQAHLEQVSIAEQELQSVYDKMMKGSQQNMNEM